MNTITITFANQINNKVFKNYTVEHEYTKEGAYIQHKTGIQVDTIKKVATKMYQQFKDKMDHESFLGEFQAQMYVAANRFAKDKTEEELNAVLDNLEEAYNFVAYTRIVIKNAILDEYIQTGEVLTDKFVDQAYYDAYMMDAKEATTNPILQWYYANKEEILTRSQLEFLEALNRNMAVEKYGKANIARTKRLIMQRVLATYEKNFK